MISDAKVPALVPWLFSDNSRIKAVRNRARSLLEPEAPWQLGGSLAQPARRGAGAALGEEGGVEFAHAFLFQRAVAGVGG